MKIICVARNYPLHAREIGAALPERPIFFIKPATAYAASGIVSYPTFSQQLEYEAELVFRIVQRAKNISSENALSIVDAITVGIDFTARDLQTQLKQQGLPWEMAKAFDGSVWWGTWQPTPPDWENIPFRLFREKHLLQEGYGRDMLFPLSRLLAEASQYFTLEPGDVFFTGTPHGVGKVLPSDSFSVYLGDSLVGKVQVQSPSTCTAS
ncbi:MAG: fumarylacetoacetate hydrolase family protein [Bacteroidia bacterium]|nr:fumarylacetoacetate hydrolase family protein [Bacteroidia bacterium]MDW8236344.1 fumarylacetoacetate hydrolase family protein [Bacteroidia bacterium]